MPRRDEKMLAQFVGRAAGGLVANAACAAARLGLRTSWAGVLGGDEDGRILRDEFAAFGVDDSLAAARSRPEGISDFTVILLDPSGERAILVVPTLAAPPPLDDGLLSALRETRAVYTLPHAPGWFAEVASATHAAGGLVAVDVESTSPTTGSELRAIIAQSDLVFCNRRGLALAAGEDDPATGAKTLLGTGPGCVIVTLGADGAWAFVPSQSVHVRGHRVPVADTTGAGDCMHAAFMKGWLAGWPLDRTLKFANAAAALSVQQVGARAGYPTKTEVETFLASQPA